MVIIVQINKVAPLNLVGCSVGISTPVVTSGPGADRLDDYSAAIKQVKRKPYKMVITPITIKIPLNKALRREDIFKSNRMLWIPNKQCAVTTTKNNSSIGAIPGTLK